jgi:PAS domain S-box-containing protein
MRPSIKDIPEVYNIQKDLYLSLIDDEGTIFCANDHMVKTLHLKDPKIIPSNFFDLLHPVNHNDFKKIIDGCTQTDRPYSVELFMKNGHYHPMKWEITLFQELPGTNKTYLCAGHKLLDDARLEKFNQLGERNYQLIVEGLNAGVLFQDRKGELIAANKKTAEIFSSTLERLYQLRNVGELWNKEWEITTEYGHLVKFEETAFMLALQTGKLQTQLLIIRMKNGEDRWIHFSSQPLVEEGSDKAYSVVSSIVDVTNERKLSQELNEKEAVFSVFMNQTPNLTWVVDEDANLIFANVAFFKYFHLDEKKSINKNIIDLVPHDVADALYEKHFQVMQTGIPAEIIKKVKWADGSEFIFHINIFPIDRVTSKKMLGGHAVNMADKFNAEKQLREANERLLQIAGAATDAIWEWDMQTGRIFRNEALMEMIGYHTDDLKGLSWWFRRMHPEDRNRVSDKIKDVTEKNMLSWQEEYRFKCADGNYKHMHDKGYVVYENGLPVKMIGSLQDVSALKNLENQLLEEKLQKQIEISETVIRVQEKERTNIGYELHDNVNQILSTVKLFIDMLTPANKKEKEIKAKSIEYILLAVEDIRKLSKELVVPQLNGSGLVGSIQSLIDDIHFSNVIRIKFTHDHENELLSAGKKITLFRIVQEQLKNILKHSGAKHVEIYLQCKNNDVQLTIKDDGIGFDPKQSPRGIGLSNIHERTRFYNGKVDIKTSAGKGCIMIVAIPILN